MLIDNGADIAMRNTTRRLCIWHVLQTRFAKLLIDNGADVNAKNNAGDMPLTRGGGCETAD